MSRITVTVYKNGLGLEAALSKLTREAQKEGLSYRDAQGVAEKRLDPVMFRQITHSDSVELDLTSLGEHIACGAPFKVTRG
jgi:hypothetical protein